MGSITSTLLGAVYLDTYVDTNPPSDDLEIAEPLCVSGTLYVTNYQVLFVQNEDTQSKISIPLTSIMSVEKQNPNDQNQPCDDLPSSLLAKCTGYITIRTKGKQNMIPFLTTCRSECH
jgi:hypothetical protein